MKIDKNFLTKAFYNIADLLIEQKSYLNEIDSKFGDGDHGVTMDKIANLIKGELDVWTDASISVFLADLGWKIMEIGGGASSLLWGTMIEGLAGPVANCEFLEADMVKKMFASGLNELCDVTAARVGDKTMMDAVIPAVEAARQATDDTVQVIRAAAKASRQGAIDSKEYIAGYGRAKNYGEKSIGTPDAGALSASLFFEGFERAL